MTTTNPTTPDPTTPPSKSSNSIPTNRELITEGSISMLYPKDVVFYNPVQVQNRDLSLIMIELYAERFYKNMVMKMKKKELLKEVKKKKKHKKDMESRDNDNGGDGGDGSHGSHGSHDIELKLNQFEQSIDWKSIIQPTFNNNNVSTTSSTQESSKYDHNEKDLLPKSHHNIPGIRILDALAASGLRSLRYYNELNPTLIDSITINDLDPAAIDLARENINYNQLLHALVDGDVDGDVDGNGNEDEGIINNDQVKDKPKIYIHNEDATQLMYLSRRKPNRFSTHIPSTTPNISTSSKLPLFTQYDVIDLDPYGTVAPFLDSALQSISDGGLLAITSTDMKTLGGSQPDTCYARYGSIPINKSKYLQEFALRILLCDIAKRAAVYGRSIKPILSIGMNFYVRVFIEVYSHGPSVKNLSCSIGTVYQSLHCPSYHIVPNGQCSSRNKNVIQPTRAPGLERCEETGCGFKAAGPIWLGPLHDEDVVNDAIDRLQDWMDDRCVKKNETSNKKRENEQNDEDKNNDGKVKSCKWKEFEHVRMGKELHGLLTSVSEELNDVPLYYVLPDLCHTLGCQTPPLKTFKAALINAGYRVSGYHKEPQAIKTDAPNHVVWDILREWCKEHPPKKNSKKKENKKNKRRKNQEGSSVNAQGNGHENADGDKGAGKESNGSQDDKRMDVVVDKPMTASEKILATEITTKVDFSIPDQLKEKKRICRFPQNPQANWGPKKAATGYKRKLEESDEEK